jgi:hypothetical protein
MRASCRSIVAVATLAVACGGEPAQVHAGRNDTLVIHTTMATVVPAVVTNAKGKQLTSTRAAFQVIGGDVLRAVDSTAIECADRGDGMIRLTAGRASSDVVVQCRPIRYIFIKHFMKLIAGGPAAPLDIGAVGVDNRPLTELAVQATVRDTSVAIVRNGQVHPRSPGRTIIDVHIGCRTWIEVTVHPADQAPDTVKYPALGAYASREIPARQMCGESFGTLSHDR